MFGFGEQAVVSGGDMTTTKQGIFHSGVEDALKKLSRKRLAEILNSPFVYQLDPKILQWRKDHPWLWWWSRWGPKFLHPLGTFRDWLHRDCGGDDY